MASSNPPINGVAFVRYIQLQDMANPGSYKANPTIAAGDFKVSIDGGALANLATLPTVTPAGSTWVKISLSAAEMTGDNISVQSIDQTAPKEWADYGFPIETMAAALGTAASQATLQTAVNAIKAKTDSLAFTVAGLVDANVIDWKGAAAPAMTGDAFARLGAPAGASVSADIAASKTVVDAIKAKTDQLVFTIANKVDSSIQAAGDFAQAAADKVWATAARILTAATNITSTGGTTVPQTGDAFARLGAPAGASVSADVAAVKAETAAIKAKTDLIPAGGPAAATDYTAARAAKLDNLDATVSSRSTYAGADTPGTANLVARLGLPANLGSGANVGANLADIAAFVDTEVGAIKAKTDNLPAAPAAVSDIPTTAQIVDKLLGRSLAGGADGGRTVQDALRASRNKTQIAAGTLTVYQEDDATPAWTAAVTTAPGNPLTSVDPA
jgi:hypothetical protein